MKTLKEFRSNYIDEDHNKAMDPPAVLIMKRKLSIVLLLLLSVAGVAMAVDEYTQYLKYASVSLEQCMAVMDDILQKYPEFNEEIKQGLGQIDKLMEEEKEIRAQLKHIAANLDLRNKARDWKKIKALLLEKVEYNIAKVAQLIHVSPKHLSANVMKNEQSELMEKAEWFDVIDCQCSCGKTNTIKIGDWFNKQVERMNLSLPFKKPNITHVAN